jgi:hypothetical protein
VTRRFGVFGRKGATELRTLPALLATVVVAIAAMSIGAARAPGAVSARCARGSVPANAAQWKAAQTTFANGFARIRTYLFNPTIANQSRMYARVDASLFQYYSYVGGQLNSNKGKASGGFTWTFVAGSQCFKRATKTTSFEVHLRAHFTSKNRQTVNVADLAKVEVKPPRITRYDRLPGH